MNKRNRLTLSIIAAVFLLACACPATSLPILNNTEEPQQIATIAPVDVIPPVFPTTAPVLTNVLLSDDFSVPSLEMETYSGEGGSAGTENGIYFVRSTADLWQWGRSNSEFENTVIEADVTMITGPANNNAGFGVVCRLTTGSDDSINGYMLAISGDGFYTIRSITASTMNALVDWTSSDVVNQGNQTNHIRATCNGSELKLEVNGQLLASAEAVAGGATSGAMAFSAISFESTEPTAEIHFDNLVISQP